ncbi:SusD/RagB family nutrient-binding outer membrane lipoprotein [Telluribacter sp. SYSU D00476]|uniref:SusD/RagB family nutrient-binding outer membrane lipoprotein n=1 Tax=Telluribacter sp. SYSU D00476 TaxID=2811430 RepID=UPI001FF53E8D|nr:SusD/RagB family nutrient-binding outer membrane lipoprotein [Telluribacter sp. SYSU D00476]
MKKVITYIAGALLLTATSCNDFLDINQTPNNPTSVPPSVLLPSALTGTAFANNNELNRFASTIMSVTAGAGGSPATYDIYNTNGGDFQNQWRFEVYGGALISYNKTIESADAIGAKAYSGIAKIMKAYTYSLATDVWGDVPYSEALLGDANTQPRVDKQEDIYKGTAQIQGLFDLVREGIADLDAPSTVKPGADDLVYGGNLANWKKAGNTILLKFANTISRKEPALAKQVIDEVLASDNYIKQNSENLNVRFGSSVGSKAPVFEWAAQEGQSFRNEVMISTNFVNLLQGKNDPRLEKFVTKPTGSYVTIVNGFRGTLPQPQSSWSRFSSYVTGAAGEGPVRLVTNAQRAFILAESAITLGTAGDAEALYQEGIRASMQAAGLTAAEITAYFTANPTEVTLTGTDAEKIEKIITQKYIAAFGNGLEQWNDWRRTGYPALPAHQNAVGIDGTRPVRAQYIDQEIARNPNFTPNIFSNVKVWWDVD